MRGVEKRNGDTVSFCLRVYLSDCLVGGLRRSVTGLINPVARGQHVTRVDIRNEKTPLNPFPGKTELQRRNNFENL